MPCAAVAPSAASFALLWLVQIPLSWLVGVQMGLGLTGVAWLLLARAALEAGAMAVIWKRWRAGPAIQPATASVSV